MPTALQTKEVFGSNIRLTPSAKFSPMFETGGRECAKYIATNDDEHAVSIDIAGPVKLKVYEILPLATFETFIGVSKHGFILGVRKDTAA